MFELIKVQAALNQFSLDGWLFYDFRGNNLLARRILDISEETMNTRRFFLLRSQIRPACQAGPPN